jgi:hypothetical protein
MVRTRSYTSSLIGSMLLSTVLSIRRILDLIPALDRISANVMHHVCSYYSGANSSEEARLGKNKKRL